MTDAEELPLGRGVGPVFRVGDRVHRPAGPWTPTVHALLDHLTGPALTDRAEQDMCSGVPMST